MLQWEHFEQQMRPATGKGSNGSSVNMSGVDNGKGTHHVKCSWFFFNDTDTNLARIYGKVRTVASSVDQFNVRLGIFLSRGSTARVL